MKMQRGVLVPAIMGALFTACAGANVSGDSSTGVAIDPSSVSVPLGGQATFSAAVVNASSKAVTWSVVEVGGGTVSSTGIYTAPATEGSYHVVVASQANPALSATAVVTVSSSSPPPPPPPGAVARPSYNSGTGFFVLNGKIYDPNGNQFIPMGVNAAHYDEAWATCSSNCGTANSGANAMRVFVYDFTNTAQNNAFMNTLKNQHIVSIPTCAGVNNGGTATSCNSSTGAITTCVSQWIAAYSTFKPFEKYMILNLANEWGDSNTTWRDTYISAIQQLRNAGYLCPIMIDQSGCGQDVSAVVNYGAAIEAADPQHNVIFSQHIYGNWADPPVSGWEQDLTSGLSQLTDTGLPVVIGEFGSNLSSNGGASVPTIPPLDIMQRAGALGMGWLAWAWDDNPSAGDSWWALSARTDDGFSLTSGQPTNGAYPHNTDLTTTGNTVVLAPTYGLFYAAKRANTFP